MDLNADFTFYDECLSYGRSIDFSKLFWAYNFKIIYIERLKKWANDKRTTV